VAYHVMPLGTHIRFALAYCGVSAQQSL